MKSLIPWSDSRRLRDQHLYDENGYAIRRYLIAPKAAKHEFLCSSSTFLNPTS